MRNSRLELQQGIMDLYNIGSYGLVYENLKDYLGLYQNDRFYKRMMKKMKEILDDE